MSRSLQTPWKCLPVAAVVVFILSLATGCGRRPVTVGSGENQFKVPAQFASNLSYPPLWGLSDAGDNSQSLALILPQLSTSGRNLFGVLHVLSEVDERRMESARNRIAHQIAEGSGEFSGGQFHDDADLRGVRAIPADIERNAYWYLLTARPLELTGSDVVARCVTDTPDRKHWSCNVDAKGKGFVVQLSIPLADMTEWASIRQRVVALVESWRI